MGSHCQKEHRSSRYCLLSASVVSAVHRVTKGHLFGGMVHLSVRIFCSPMRRNQMKMKTNMRKKRMERKKQSTRNKERSVTERIKKLMTKKNHLLRNRNRE